MWKGKEDVKKYKLWSGCLLNFSFFLWLSWFHLNARECYKLHWNTSIKKHTLVDSPKKVLNTTINV